MISACLLILYIFTCFLFNSTIKNCICEFFLIKLLRQVLKPNCIFKNVQNYSPGHAVATNMEQIQEDQEEKRTVHIIRNFVEKIIEGLIDNVDDTSIDRLYKNSECKCTLHISHFIKNTATITIQLEL